MHRRRVGVLPVKGLPRGEEGRWSSVEKACHINILELEAVRLAILSFTKFKTRKSIHLRIDNMTALSYFLKMGGTKNKHLIKISKETWGYLIDRKMHLTAEYILSLSNQVADWASRDFQDSSEWKLCPTVFKQICSYLGKPLVNLFASGLCHQLPRYIA